MTFAAHSLLYHSTSETDVASIARTRRRIWALWAAVHTALFVMVGLFGYVRGDITYYFRGLYPEYFQPPAPEEVTAPLQEYPDAGTWPLRFLTLITSESLPVFTVVFLLFNITLSGLFLYFLLRGAIYPSPRTDAKIRAAWFWTLFCATSGPILLTRLDMIPGLLVAVSAALLITAPGIAATLLGLATMSKLWPGVLAAGLVGSYRAVSTWRRLLWFCGSLTAFALVTITTSGMDRLLSPLTYQDDRGLQIESIAATPFMVAAALFPDTWHISFAASKSFEIFGPGVPIGITVTTALLVATLTVGLGVAILRFLRGGWTHDYAIGFFILLVVLLIVSNKVFSPQYMTWLGPLVAVMLLHIRTLDDATLVRIILPILLATALTLVIYPLTYQHLLDGPYLYTSLILATRNLLMLLVLYSVARHLVWPALFPRRSSMSQSIPPIPR